MLRKIIKIDNEKCNGCGACVLACHESAIGLINGKAKILRDDYCDGLGDCLPTCPVNAITFEQRETVEYDNEAVKANKLKEAEQEKISTVSQLNQWPIQIKLLPETAPYFKNADLLIAADCTAYAYGDFHNEFIKNKITLIGCPKLDVGDYSEKLTAIIKKNDIKSITVVKMEVPCCQGIVNAVQTALHQSGKAVLWKIITITTDGKIYQKMV